MIRLLVSGIARVFAEPPVRDTDAPASTGPITLSDAQTDQVSGGAFGQVLTTAVGDPARPDIRIGFNISNVATALQNSD